MVIYRDFEIANKNLRTQDKQRDCVSGPQNQKEKLYGKCERKALLAITK